MINAAGLDPTQVALDRRSQKAGAAGAVRDEKLEGACRQVESLFINQLFHAMSKSSLGEGMAKKSVANDVFATQRNAALAEEMGSRGDMGLARMLYEELARGLADRQEQAEPVEADGAIAAMAGNEEM